MPGVSVNATISLGSNLGNRLRSLQQACIHLQQIPSTSLLSASSVYETEPVGGPEQDDYLNAVVQIRTELDSAELLQELQKIENLLGRVRSIHWGPRTLDLDLLAMEQEVLSITQPVSLELPHPRLALRRFVLVPWADIEPDWWHPVLGKTVVEMLKDCPDTSGLLPFAPAEVLLNDTAIS